MTNITIPATEAKTKFAELIDAARNEPVTVTRNSKPVAVVISPEDYERLSAVDDAYWGNKATQAKKAGFLGKKKTSDFISNTLNSKN